MTVAEVVAELQKLPAHLPVVAVEFDYYGQQHTRRVCGVGWDGCSARIEADGAKLD